MRLELWRFRISPVPPKSAVGIVAILALFGTSVQAADLPAAPSSAPIPVSTPNWTGPYIGLDVGMRYDAVDANVTSATVGTPPTAIALPPAKPPSGNFFETAAPLTAVKLRPQLHVLYTTGRAITDGMKACFVAGSATLAKPYTVEELRDSLLTNFQIDRLPAAHG